MRRDRLGTLDQSVMYAVLRRRNDAYGVEIQQEITEQTGQERSVGAIYGALDRLEKDGLVTSRMGEATPERGGRAKKYFSVTGAGQAALRDAERELDAMRAGLSAGIA